MSRQCVAFRSAGGRTAGYGCPHVLRRQVSLSSFHTPYIPVLQYGELLDDEPVGIVVRTPRILKRTGGDKASLGHVALTDDQLSGVCMRLVGIDGKVAHHAVHVYHLVDVARNQPVVISLFGKVHIVVIGALVRQLQGTVDVVADGLFLWREREEQLVKASYVFPRLGRTILRKILRKGHHQRLTPVQY